MNHATPINEALNLPNGARFLRCALQVNPVHYAATYRGQTHGMGETEYVKATIAKCVELGIGVIAITDHNHAGSINLLREEGEKNGIHVFPGFEVASTEGVHLLCLYPADTQLETLSRHLGEFGIRDVDPSSKLSSKTLTDLLAAVKEQGGVSIAAHVTQDGGLLHVLHGQTRINAWKDKNLLAVQIPGSVDDTPVDKRPILRNQNPEYKRDPGAGPDLAIAVVNAKDVTCSDDLEDPSSTCWIKMSEVSIEGLRQAFLDPTSRIRLSTDPLPEQHSEFVAMSWQGGFLDGAMIHLNENLNVLVGGRGTGKSTVVESLRYVLGLEPLGEDAKRGHDGIIRQVLRSGTKVSLLVRSYTPSRCDYLVERTIPNPSVVRDANGSVLNLAPTDLISQVEVYGQHEISELTKSREKLTHLLERFVERDASLQRRKGDLVRELERSRGRVLEVNEELTQIGERLASLPALEEMLRRYQNAGLEERLKEQSLLVREERVLKTGSERISPFRDLLEQLQRNLPIDRAFVSPKALEGLPGKEILAELDTALEGLNRDLDALATQMGEVLNRADQGIAAIRVKWDERKKLVQAAYEKILRELQQTKVDGAEFIRLRQQIEELRPLKERLASLNRDLKEQENHRRNLLAEWEEVKAEEYRQLNRASTKVTRKLDGRVRVRVACAGNREPLLQLLREEVGGRLQEAVETLKQRQELSLTELAAACRLGRDALAKQFGLPLAQAERVSEASPKLFMQIEEIDLPPTTSIELNVAAEGDAPAWQTLDDLSTGQKATAVLLLLLLESDAPLVVDQPEDDLDNRFITEGIVPRMREEKRRRQFVFATHNANIPVLGDAELIVGLTAAGEAGHGKAKLPTVHMGSIDSRPVRELVEEVLEGGKVAFEMRRLKYGF